MGIEQFFGSIEENTITNLESSFTKILEQKLDATYLYIDFNHYYCFDNGKDYRCRWFKNLTNNEVNKNFELKADKQLGFCLLFIN